MAENSTPIFTLTNQRETLLWKDSIFIFDSSALLSFYSMPAQTRKKIYDSIMLPNIHRFWIPGHVKFEYLKNREKVIVKPISESYDKLEKDVVQPIENVVRQLILKTKELGDKIKNQDTHPYFDDTEVKAFSAYLESLKTAHDTFKSGLDARIASSKQEIESLKSADDFLDFFDKFTIGRDFSFDEIYQITHEGKHRYEFKIPPGYEDLNDKDKIGTQIFGDLIIWKQILEFSKGTDKPILLICDDLKMDWCYTKNASGEKRIERPREELIKEIKDYSGCDFWMYNLPQFLFLANQQWGGTIDKKEIDALAKVISEADQGKPSLELELVPTGSMRRNSGNSDKNPTQTDEHGQRYINLGAQNNPIIHWDLTWEMQLRIHNQSSYPAFNISLEQGNEKWFSVIEPLSAINSLAPLSMLKLDIEHYGYLESDHFKADELLKKRIPGNLDGLVIVISYQNEEQKIFEKRYRIENGTLNLV
jgi:hypothetical protein